MCDTLRMLAIASDMFSDKLTVSVGTRHIAPKGTYDKLSDSDLTVLLGGRIEFNSYRHRRDMVDVMLHYNLYVKRLSWGVFQSGVHGNEFFVVRATPTEAISEAAYFVVRGDKN